MRENLEECGDRRGAEVRHKPQTGSPSLLCRALKAAARTRLESGGTTCKQKNTRHTFAACPLASEICTRSGNRKQLIADHRNPWERAIIRNTRMSTPWLLGMHRPSSEMSRIWGQDSSRDPSRDSSPESNHRFEQQPGLQPLANHHEDGS
jgi:hypothetical protein